jgi:YD repeat-containing protein
LAPYVLGLPATEDVTISTETFRRTWSYTDPAYPGLLTQTTGFARPGATGITTNFVRGDGGNVQTAATATSSTSYSYSWGAISQIATAEHSVSRVINADGTVASETKGGRTTAFQYDDLGRQTLVTPPGGTNPTTTVYDSNGTTITTTRGTTPETISSLTTYLDGFGRPTGTLNSQGVRTTTRYDPEGRIEYRGLPFLGSADVGTTITYDALDRVTEEAHSGGAHRDYSYGADTTTIIDEEGRTTVHRFVAFGHPDDARLTIVTDAKQQPWTYAYDALGRIRSVTASDGISRTWEYNDQALLFRETHPESGVTTYQYNAGGVLTQKTDAKGQTFVYTHDGNDRVRTVTVGSEFTTFTYEEGSDNRKSMGVDGVHTAFSYDAAGRPASRVDTLDGFQFTTTFGYDNNDNLTSIFYPSFGSSGDRRRVAYEYDSEHRITRVRDLLVTRDFANNFSYHPSGSPDGVHGWQRCSEHVHL